MHLDITWFITIWFITNENALYFVEALYFAIWYNLSYYHGFLFYSHCFPVLPLQYMAFVFLLDINECKDVSKNKCEQGCLNTRGSFDCYCKRGFKSDPENPTKCLGELTPKYICRILKEWPFINQNIIGLISTVHLFKFKCEVLVNQPIIYQIMCWSCDHSLVSHLCINDQQVYQIEK